MPDGILDSDGRLDLVEVVRRVRNRWRLKLALRGATIVGAGMLLALLVSASSLEALRFSPASIIFFRLFALVAFGALVWFGLVRPLRRRVTDSQVALYLEERDPSLQTAILSAVEATSRATDASSPTGPSPKLIERLVDQAIERCRAMEDGLVVERQGLRRNFGLLAGLTIGAALLVGFGPTFLRHGLSALLVVSRSAEAASPYHIEVQPGDTTIPRGGDQVVTAKLLGFTASNASLMIRTAPGDPFELVPLAPSDDPEVFEGLLFRIERQTEYYVESNGVKSPTFSMSVLDLPTVERLVLEYHFPAYANLPPRTMDPGGDIAVLKGTEVQVRVTPTMTTPGGRVRLNESESAALTTEPDGTLAGSFTVEGQGFYEIELDGAQGEKVDASPQYMIDLLTDNPPTVSLAKPGRDTQATAIEEVFAEVRADDDFGVGKVQLFYSVNGGTEQTVNLFGGARTLSEVTASHTLYLEELGLNPGDFISYYAKATDNDAVQGPKTSTSDIYFVQIRPFRIDFRAAQSMGGGGGGGAGQEVGQLSRQQREIVAATFNSVRDRAKTTDEKFRENTVFLALAQERLRQQVEELAEKVTSRLDVVDPSFEAIAAVLPQAAAEMKLAEADLKEQKAKDALTPEQRALKLLQQAEQQYEMQVAMQQGGGGGGGGGQMANDLADLFELELDKLANQYEMQQRANMEGGDQQVDELVEKLKELARRQQQEAERQRRMAAAGGAASGGGDLQRQLAQEAEEVARRLEQLTREQQRQNFSDAARQLQEAANAMREAAANGSRDGGAQAAEALERLQEAQRRLQQTQDGRAERGVQDALRRAEELVDEQRQTAADVQALPSQQPATERQARSRALAQRKDTMDAEVAALQQQLEQIANEARRDDRDAARKLDEAAVSITDRRIREMIRYTRNQLQMQMPQGDYARTVEGMIGTNLGALQSKIEEAAAAVGEAAKDNALERAVDQTREAVRRMESLEQRMRDRAQRGQEGEQAQGSQQAQRGEQGQQGQGGEGQQGQGSEQGQEQGQEQGGSQSASGEGAQGGALGGGYGYSPEDMRQFRRELQEWQTETEALRRDLVEAGVDPRDLDAILRDIQGLDSDRIWANPQSLQALQASALERLRQFEFSLRRQIETDSQPLALSGSDEVPAGFREAIEEYYRSLSRR